MKVIYRNSIFVALCATSAERDAVKRAGFAWHPFPNDCRIGITGNCAGCKALLKKPAWWTRRLECAARLSAYADDDAKQALAKHLAAVKMSRATSADIDIPAPRGLSYLGYQKAGIVYMADREGTLLGDEQGTGKTIQVLGLINLDQSIKQVLVVCPATLRTNWAIKEAPKWLVNDSRKWNIHIVDEDAPVPARANFVVVHYNRVTIGFKRCDGPCGGEKRKTIPCPKCKGTGSGPKPPLLCDFCNGNKHIFCARCKGRGRYANTNVKVVESLHSRKWDLIVADESHFLKNIQAKRTKAILGDRYKKKPGLADIARKRLFLTGTPIPNRPFEIWPIASALAPETFGNMKAFMRRYCNGHEEWVSKTKKIWKFDGATNLEELQEKLRGACLLRRLKQDVLKELPAKRRQIIALPPTEEAKTLIAQEAEEWEKKFSSDMAIVEATAQIASESNDQQAWDAAAEKLKYIQKVAFMEMARIRRQLALVKVPTVIEYLDNMFEEGVDKIICFAHHKEVIHKIQEHFGKSAVSLFGETKMNDRQRAVDLFQDPKSPIKIFIGGIMAAGTGITLTASSNVVFAEEDWTPGTINQCEDRAHRVGQHSSVLVQHLVLDGSLDARMIQMIVEKQEIADRALDRSTDVAVGDEPALPRPDITIDDTPTTPVELWKKVALKEALIVIAQRREPTTDGPRGFSHFDNSICNSLANSRSTFSDKQAHLAIKFVTKYRHQLSQSNPHLAKQLGIFELPPEAKIPGFQRRESHTVLDKKQRELMNRLFPPG